MSDSLSLTVGWPMAEGENRPQKPGESIWKPGEYLLENELMRFACEHRQVFRDNEPANARLSTDGTPRVTKSEFWKDCAKRLNHLIAERPDLFATYGILTQGDASQKFRNLKKVYLQKLHKAHETGNFDEVKSMRHYQSFCKIYEKERTPTLLEAVTAGIASSSNIASFMMDSSSPIEEMADDDSDTFAIGHVGSTSDTFTAGLFASQTSLALLLKISTAIENARTEARIHWMNIESHLNRQNIIENERNQILSEQNKLEKERLEFEKEKFEFEKTKAQTGTSKLQL